MLKPVVPQDAIIETSGITNLAKEKGRSSNLVLKKNTHPMQIF
jgi:hypothetical protein